MKLTRRTFLRAAGVSLGLPMLDAFAPAQNAAAPPRRMVCICTPLSLHPAYFFPQAAGRDYTLTPYLEVLRAFRNDFTVMSGLAHPQVGSSHDSIFSFLTAAPHPERRAGFRNSISLDQFAARHIGGETRFPALALSCEGFSLSWTQSGAIVPSDSWPSGVFRRLFLEGRPDEVETQVRRLRDGRSILDAVGDQARRLQPKLGTGDRDKLDEYFNSVRELERGLARSEAWSRRPRPRVNVPIPQDIRNGADFVGKARLMYDLIHLALQTDSSRLFTLLLLGTSAVPPIAGVSLGHHDLSHHGQDPTKIAQLRTVELEGMRAFAGFLRKLKDTREHGATLLDHTSVFFSSNLGNASSHSTRNLPVILAGGGFRHGQHLAFTGNNAPPLSNLYVSMLRRTGINADRFGSSTGTLTGLEHAG
ncbi:MAG: DUF1552 domain-containing protein [Planctomycetes bacterium]|nr:DUF1552 domain-containing protein [Planctomycetota bacterium]